MLALIGASKPWSRASSQCSQQLLPTRALPQAVTPTRDVSAWLKLAQSAWAAAADCTARFQDADIHKAHAGFGWGRINFLPRVWYRAVVGICDKHKHGDKRYFHYC